MPRTGKGLVQPTNDVRDAPRTEPRGLHTQFQIQHALGLQHGGGGGGEDTYTVKVTVCEIDPLVAVTVTVNVPVVLPAVTATQELF